MPEQGILPPGSTIGVLGTGQLGRMIAVAAAQLGYKCHVFGPEDRPPAAQVAGAFTQAAFEDEDALEAFAQVVNVVTLEFENVPLSAVAYLAARRPLHPRSRVLEIAQDRALEKEFFNDIGVATAPWAEVDSVESLVGAAPHIGAPAILKSARLGYDGKGQVFIDGETELEEAWREMGAGRGVLEGFVPFEREVSVIVARAMDGTVVPYLPVENHHDAGILRRTVVPAPLAQETAVQAEDIAIRAAEELDVVGLLAVEMFVTSDGAVLANEMAPRPHNSGHWTLDAAPTSQFEQLVRAVCGLPLGLVDRYADAEMINLIGADAEAWLQYLAKPGAHLHLYGKAEARPGRKMGHVTRLTPRSD